MINPIIEREILSLLFLNYVFLSKRGYFLKSFHDFWDTLILEREKIYENICVWNRHRGNHHQDGSL